MNEQDRIIADALSLKLFDRNVNPNPSKAWLHTASEEELATWQHGDAETEALLRSRLKVAKAVKNYSQEMMEEDSGLRHYVPALETDLEPLRNVNIADFTLQPVKRRAKRSLTLCPFHDDRHPSCVLYERKGFYCFSCGKGGNAIDWAMAEFGFTMPQAVDFLQKYT
jgi:hypothetical protein